MNAVAEHPTSNSQQPTSNGRLPTAKGDGFIVRWRGYGVKFHTNACGRVYSLVAEKDATRFESQAEALRKCLEMNLRVREVEVLTVD